MMRSMLAGFALMMLAAGVIAAEQGPLVRRGDDGKLIYAADARGNTIPDFSRSGYAGGGVALPDLPVKVTLAPEPGTDDETARIQAAIDQVAAMAPVNGVRGAVLLKKGTYRVARILNIATDGVVLRGEGQGPDGTILLATGKKRRTLIMLQGDAKINKIPGSERKIINAYVPWGAKSFTVDSVAGLKVLERVIIHRPATEAWIRELKMDQIVPRPGTQQWTARGYNFDFERTITAIDGNIVTLDAPVVNAMEDKWGGGSVVRYEESGRIRESGVENLRLVSEYEKGKENEDEAHAWTGVSVDSAENCWVRNLTTVHFSHGVSIGQRAIFVTAQDCAVLAPVSIISGGRRYPFSINGQFCLVQRCYSDESRHAEATGARVRGPNVFLDCLAENTHADTGPHHRWAVGILWDNLKGGDFNAQDRANWGTGHGWAGAQQVFWNCEPDTICVQQPPTGQNYAIGCTGEITKGRMKDRPAGYYESHGKHVEPRSLYLAQLEARLGAEAVANVTTASQREGMIYDELKERLGK